METMVRSAKMEDTGKLINFLEKANLGVEGVEESIDYFLILEDGLGNIKATLGIEPFGDIGLLRSLVVTSKATEKELLVIFEQMLILAKKKEIQSLYLATNKEGSTKFFKMMGFTLEEKEKLPQELFQSEHVKHIFTVDNSIFMKLTL